MKRLNKKLTFQLSVLGVVAVCGAIAIAQALPRLRPESKPELVEPGGVNDNVTPSIRISPIPMHGEPTSARTASTDTPSSLGSVSNSSITLQADSGFGSMETPRWEEADASHAAAIAVDREMQVPSTYNEIPEFDEPPSQAD